MFIKVYVFREFTKEYIEAYIKHSSIKYVSASGLDNYPSLIEDNDKKLFYSNLSPHNFIEELELLYEKIRITL